MLIKYSTARKVFYLRPGADMTVDDVPKVQKAGFNWYDAAKIWVTTDLYRAATLFYAENCKIDDLTFNEIRHIARNLRLSHSTSSLVKIDKPKKEAYMDFQKAGIEAACERFSNGHKAALIADPMGLGKSIMGAGVINHNLCDPIRVLVVCPASLRHNWARELDKWITWPESKAFTIINGKDSSLYRIGPLIVSYELTLNDQRFTLIWYTHT